MKTRQWKIVLLVIFGWIGLFCFGCSERKEIVPVQAGIMVPQTGIVIDVDYDPRLDNLVPGYKLLTVAIDNNTLTPFHLDPAKDRWEVQDSRGRWQPALHDLKSRREVLWRKLPNRIREIIDYPEVVGVGETGVFDIFLKSSLTLEGFRGVRYDSTQIGKVVEVQREP